MKISTANTFIIETALLHSLAAHHFSIWYYNKRETPYIGNSLVYTQTAVTQSSYNLN